MRRLLSALLAAALVPLLAAPAPAAPPKKDAKKADGKKVAVFRLTGSIKESPAEDSFGFGPTAVSLKDLVARLKKAREDSAVKAVALLIEGGPGSAQTEELRQAIAQLRAAGKEVYAHADGLTMRSYLLASGASRVSVVPTGDLWITGLYGESPYLRGLLNKLGVQPDFIAMGEYKSASEIFMREGPSPAAERMQNWLLDSMFDTDVRLIAHGRHVDPAKVKEWIDNGPYTAEKAKAAGLIDAVESREGFERELKKKFGHDVVFDKRYGRKAPPKIDFSSPFAMFRILDELMGETKKKPTKAAVGVVYVDGAIVLGGGGDSLFDEAAAGSTEIRKALDEAARDNTIKAVVLRVDSPGGSAVASEIILDATRRLKAKKPFVVSMGDVAGSGGYYVACAADTIFADESTITGSIGVVSGKFVTNPMWKKVGVTFKEYKRGKNAGLLSSGEPFSKEERAHMEEWMEDIYKVFKGHVVAIRGKKLKKPIDELAGGRVYTGKQALDLGLVDRIGTLQDAIEYIAGQAKISNYDVRVVPAPKNFIERILEEAAGGDDEGNRLDARAGVPSLVELALPYLRHLDPERVAAVKMGLRRMQLIQKEGAVLMMPEMLFRR